mgnify:CR=1 FL=1
MAKLLPRLMVNLSPVKTLLQIGRVISMANGGDSKELVPWEHNPVSTISVSGE